MGHFFIGKFSYDTLVGIISPKFFLYFFVGCCRVVALGLFGLFSHHSGLQDIVILHFCGDFIRGSL